MCHQFKDYRTVFTPWKGEPWMKPLGLHYCDSGALLTLLSTMGSLQAANLHAKLNRYFLDTMGAVGVIMERVNCPSGVKVRAIGRLPLSQPLLFKDECSTLQEVMMNKGPTRMEKGKLEGELYCQLEKVLKEEYKRSFCNCLFFPIDHPLEKGYYTHFVGLVNFKEFDGCERIYNGIVTECMSHCYGMLRSACNYEEEKMNSKRCSTMLKSFIEIFSWTGSNLVYDKVQQEAKEVLDAAKCSVFIHDAEFKLVARALQGGLRHNSKENTDDGSLNYTTTAAKVAMRGQPVNIPVVQEDPLYTELDATLTGDCRSLLSFPLKLDGKLLGVIEVYDKNLPGLRFTEEDMELTRPFTTIVANAIKANKIFYHFRDLKSKQQFLDCVLLRRTKPVENNLVDDVMNCKLKHNFQRITDFRFDPRVVPENHVLCICLTIFESSGLLYKFKIKRQTFVRFLVKLKEAHSEVPFHNWNQAFLTFHFVFIVVNQYNLIKDGFVTVLEYFCLLMTALCHSLDHRGPTSMFDMTTGTVLASLFSSPGSVAQMHHLSQALRLMTYPECNILQHIDDEEFHTFAVMFREMMIDTNLEHQGHKLPQLEAMMKNGYDKDVAGQRRLFHYLIINCAQLCYACKPWSLCRKIGEDCFQEFFRKGDLEQAQGVFEVPDFNEDILKLPEMNSHFIQTIVLPSFRTLALICPLVYLCLIKIEKNLEAWKEEKDKIMATMAKNMDDESAEEEEDVYNFFK